MLFSPQVAWSARASLCVTLGTSLCGMTSDEIPRAAAERFARGQGDGLVIIGLQRTFYDEAKPAEIVKMDQHGPTLSNVMMPLFFPQVLMVCVKEGS